MKILKYIIKNQKGLLSKLMLPVLFLILGLTSLIAVKIVQHSVENNNMQTIAQIEAIMNNNTPAAGGYPEVETVVGTKKELTLEDLESEE